MKKKRLVRSGVFMTYFHSNIFVLVILIIVLAFVGLWYISENMKAEEKRIAENKLSMIAEDMETQVESIRKTVIMISSLQDFDQNYFKRNKYYEMEMLNLLGLYKNNFYICEEYFIKYDNDDTIYSSGGKTFPLELYYTYKIGKGNRKSFFDLMNTPVDKLTESILLYRQGDMVIFLYPMPEYAVGANGKEGKICFVIQEKSLQNRIQKMIGKMDGDLTVYYKDFCILGKEEETGDDIMYISSAAGNFTISYGMNDSGHFTWGNVITPNMLCILAGIIILIVVLGYVGAYLNFQPFQKIVNKYTMTEDVKLEATWDSVDELINLLMHGKKRNIELLEAQKKIIKEQLIQLISIGKYSDRVEEYMMLMGISLEAPLYGLVRCDIPEGQIEMAAFGVDICEEIETLTDEDLMFHAYRGEMTGIGVLVGMEEEYQIEEVLELLQSLFETKNIEAVIEIEGIFHELKEICHNAVKQPAEEQIPIEKVAEEMKMKYSKTAQKSITGKALAYIEANCTSYDLSLEQVARECGFSAPYLSKMIKQENGKSYKEYLIEYRIEKAKEMLCKEDISVAEVCQRAGYTNVPHFIKVFQKYTGMTPAKYRALKRDGQV